MFKEQLARIWVSLVNLFQEDKNEELAAEAGPQGGKPFHYESGQPIFDGPAERREREEHERAEEKKKIELTQLDIATKQASIAQQALITQILLVVFGLISAAVGIYQAESSREAANAAILSAKVGEHANYIACLNAKATQVALLQVQRSASDSHISALATVEQLTAGILADRAVVSFTPTIPRPEEAVTNNLSVPFSVRNEGKTDALGVKIVVKAVLLDVGENLQFHESEKAPYTLVGQSERIPAGFDLAGKSSDPRFRPLTYAVFVQNSMGGLVLLSSKEAKQYLSNGMGFAATYGHIKYSDYSGTHKLSFCKDLTITKAGTVHETTRNEVICGKYNHQEDNYTAIPRIAELPPIDLTQISPLECQKPNNSGSK